MPQMTVWQGITDPESKTVAGISSGWRLRKHCLPIRLFHRSGPVSVAVPAGGFRPNCRIR